MKAKKIIFIIIIVLILTLVVSVVLLEVLNKVYKCKSPRWGMSFPCLEEVSQSDLLKENSELLVNLKERRLEGKKISKKEYRQAADIFILEVDPAELNYYLNGISCKEYDYGYVRNDLSKAAKKFVRRHELEHLLQTGEERNPEFSANFAAGKEYPFGFLQTIFFTLKNRAKHHDSFICYILSLWKTFKIYFLPFSS